MPEERNEPLNESPNAIGSLPRTEPWEHPDGSTNVDGWLVAYAEDDNTFWRTEQGHIMNVVDELIDRLAQQ
jgi:hypothetical protein